MLSRHIEANTFYAFKTDEEKVLDVQFSRVYDSSNARVEGTRIEFTEQIVFIFMIFQWSK